MTAQRKFRNATNPWRRLRRHRRTAQQLTLAGFVDLTEEEVLEQLYQPYGFITVDDEG